MIAPGLATLDFSLMKKWPLTFLGQEGNVEFRSEFFNILNHANFGGPATVVFAASGARQGGPGRISATTTTGRQIQLGLKVTF